MFHWSLIILLSITPTAMIFAESDTITNQCNNSTSIQCNNAINCCCCTNQNSSDKLIDSIISTIIPAIITGIIGVTIKEILVDKIKKRNLYFVPYTQWAIRFAGALNEFREICKIINKKKADSTFKADAGIFKDDYSATDIISHLWTIHKEVEEGYKWLSMFKKIDEKSGNSLDDMMDAVDRTWHKLEAKFEKFLVIKTERDLKKILYDIAKLDKANRTTEINDIASFIIQEIRNAEDEASNKILQENNFKAVTERLEKKVPTGVRETLGHCGNWFIEKLKNKPKKV